MKHFRSFLSLAFAGLVLALPALPRSVFVIPSTGTGNITVLDYTLGSSSTFSAPANAFKVLSDPVGNNYMVVSGTASQAVNFYPKPPGSVAPTTIPLTQAPSTATVTPEGTKLLVTGTNNLYIIDTVSRSLSSTIQVGAAPHFLAVSSDSRLAYILSAGSDSLFAVDLTSGQIVTQVSVSGGSGIAVSPNGLVYVSNAVQVLEYNPTTLALRAAITVSARTGSLAFSADGRTGLAANLSSLNQAGSSLFVLDLSTRTVTGSITIGSSAAPIVPETLYVLDGGRAIGYSPRSKRIYDIRINLLQAFEAAFQPAANVSSIAVSDEKVPRYLYFSTDTGLGLVNIASDSTTTAVTLVGGSISFAGPASVAAPVQTALFNDNQTISAGLQFIPIALQVLDSDNRPIYNVNVGFSTAATGVTVTKRNTFSGTNGQVVATVSAPADIGTFSVIATLPTGLTRTFTMTSGSSGGGGGGGGGGGSGTTAFSKVSGDGQLYLVNKQGNSLPFIVELKDGNGNPLNNQSITWALVGDGIVFPNQNFTNEKGQAEGLFLSNTASVPFGSSFATSTITATAPTGQTVTFGLTLIPSDAFVPTVSIDPPPGQRNLSAKSGSTLTNAIRFLVLTGGGGGTQPGQPIPNVALTASTAFAPAQGPSASCRGGAALSDTAGQGSCDLVTAGKIGTADMPVRVGGIFSENFTLTLTAGNPASLTIVQGNNQTVNANQTTPSALVAQVTDSYGNSVVGANVAWSSVTPSALSLVNTISTSDSTGRVSTLARSAGTPGTFQVRLVAGTGTVDFNVTVNASLGSLTRISGQENPTVVVGNPFPQPLVVQVNSVQGQPVAGVTVSWTATNGSVTGSSVTNDRGQASATVTAGNSPGQVVVTASVTGLPAVTFTLQARLPGPDLSAGSFTNFATGQPGIVRGGLVLIKAAGLAPNVNGTVNANLLSGILPVTLADVTVQFGTAFAPIYQVANVGGVETVLVQAPFEIQGTITTATVTVKGGAVNVPALPVVDYGPGILEEVVGGRRQAIAIRSDGFRVTPATPARRGERIRIYTIGLGQTNPVARTNAVGTPSQTVVVPVIVGLNDGGVTLISAEMAENLIGVYEVTLEIPANMVTGEAVKLGLFVEPTPGNAIYANGSSLPIAVQ